MLWNLILNHAFSYYFTICVDDVWSTGGGCGELDYYCYGIVMISDATTLLYCRYCYCITLLLILYASHDFHVTSFAMPCSSLS